MLRILWAENVNDDEVKVNGSKKIISIQNQKMTANISGTGNEERKHGKHGKFDTYRTY